MHEVRKIYIKNIIFQIPNFKFPPFSNGMQLCFFRQQSERKYALGGFQCVHLSGQQQGKQPIQSKFRQKFPHTVAISCRLIQNIRKGPAVYFLHNRPQTVFLPRQSAVYKIGVPAISQRKRQKSVFLQECPGELIFRVPISQKIHKFREQQMGLSAIRPGKPGQKIVKRLIPITFYLFESWEYLRCPPPQQRKVRNFVIQFHFPRLLFDNTSINVALFLFKS